MIKKEAKSIALEEIIRMLSNTDISEWRKKRLDYNEYLKVVLEVDIIKKQLQDKLDKMNSIY